MTPLDRLLDFFARFSFRIRLPQSRGGRVALALVFIYFVWGSTYSGLHFALQSFPPLLLSGLRNLLGGIGLFIFALRRKPEWPTLLEIRNAGIVGTMLVALSSGTIALGISSVSSGSAAVMVATVPLFATVIAAVAGRPVTKGEWAAVALGMVGIVVLNSGGAAAQNSALGTICVLAGALFWAGGAHLATRLKLPSDLFLSTSLQIGLGGMISTLVAWLIGERIEHVMVGPVFAFLYLMVFCTMAAYVAYGYLIRHTSPIIASSCMYVNPIVAVALGALLLGEPVTMATVVATVAILGSVGLSFVFDPARRPAARGSRRFGGRGSHVGGGGFVRTRADRGAGCGTDPGAFRRSAGRADPGCRDGPRRGRGSGAGVRAAARRRAGSAPHRRVTPPWPVAFSRAGRRDGGTSPPAR
ncbi:EamA-like transporter family [Burkholderia cepacia]|nr:EamA-like transporter family [Burkholderia cepacia]